MIRGNSKKDAIINKTSATNATYEIGGLKMKKKVLTTHDTVDTPAERSGNQAEGLDLLAESTSYIHAHAMARRSPPHHQAFSSSSQLKKVSEDRKQSPPISSELGKRVRKSKDKDQSGGVNGLATALEENLSISLRKVTPPPNRTKLLLKPIQPSRHSSVSSLSFSPSTLAKSQPYNPKLLPQSPHTLPRKSSPPSSNPTSPSTTATYQRPSSNKVISPIRKEGSGSRLSRREILARAAEGRLRLSKQIMEGEVGWTVSHTAL